MSDPTAASIDGDTFANALVSGVHRVIGQQELLNRINVFPVADSDTGTNLSLSLGAALGVLRGENEKHLGTLLAALADALLDGARGNSGAILAQFFQGVSDSAGELTRFTTYTFGKAVKLGAEYAHDALSAPREGTILTAIATFATSVTHQVNNAPDANFKTIIEQARRDVDMAVADTPKQLEVLRKAGVVDAGAKGFAELVAGVSDYLAEGEILPMPDTAQIEIVEPPVQFSAADNTSQYRFCTECLVIGSDINRRKLRESLAEIGDSLVLAGSKQKAKIHIHADDPRAVFEIARQFGELDGQKADDMHRQQSATHDDFKSFAVITDSGADIPDDDMDRLDIHVVPCRIQFGDRAYLDKVSITTEEFYTELEDNPHHPTTSQPSPGDFRRQFKFLSSHFSEVLSINLTAQASGTCEGALSAARRDDGPGKIRVIDSRNASFGQGMLVTLAAECAAAGIDIERAAEIIEAEIPKVRTFAMLSDLSYPVRGGRLPHWVKTVADLLRLTPILGFKAGGKIGLAGFLLGKKNRVRKFARYVARHLPAGSTIEAGIGHAVCPQDANDLASAIREEWPSIDTLKISTLGTAIGVHGGPGTLIVSARPSVSVDDFTDRVD